jgi:alpha-tubulin suppressor-like RCC1 family protein
LDDTSANTTGGYAVITGSGFNNGSTVIFGTTTAPAVSYVNSTTLRTQIPALAAASYPVYVVNSNGATGIKINGLTTSSFPAWSTGATLSNTSANTAFGVNLSATSDSNITYANTTSLPAGTTLLANGYFYGTVTIGVQTTYTFTVDAKDAENQDALRTFSLTVTVTPPYKLWAWGAGPYGSTGQNDTVYRSSPTQVGSLTTWSNISVGDYSSSSTKTDGTLWTWGFNTSGQLGSNSVLARSSPVQVGALTNWNKIITRAYSGVSIKTDGTLWTWGRADLGQLGLNSVNGTGISSPTQVGTDTNWNLISFGSYCLMAIRTNGTLWTCGTNVSGQLGLNDNIRRSSPTQIGSQTDWSLVSVNGYNTTAIRSGTLWVWGANANGQLGQNDRVVRSSPIQLGAGTTWSKISTGKMAVFAIKTDGTLWAWGNNGYGQLGQNNTTYRSSPVQIGADTNWSLVECGSYHVLATKTNGTLWSWGRNETGQLGQNIVSYRSSPVQVGSATSWYSISSGGAHSMAISN